MTLPTFSLHLPPHHNLHLLLPLGVPYLGYFFSFHASSHSLPSFLTVPLPENSQWNVCSSSEPSLLWWFEWVIFSFETLLLFLAHAFMNTLSPSQSNYFLPVFLTLLEKRTCWFTSWYPVSSTRMIILPFTFDTLYWIPTMHQTHGTHSVNVCCR